MMPPRVRCATGSRVEGRNYGAWLWGAAIVCVLAAAGCSTTSGTRTIQSHYCLPHDQVTRLGVVRESKSKIGFFVVRQVTDKDIARTLNAAIARRKGADLLINVRTDTTVTRWPILPVNVTKLTIEGTACSLETQDRELFDAIRY